MFHMTTFGEPSTLMSEGVLMLWQKGLGGTQDRKGWERTGLTHCDIK